MAGPVEAVAVRLKTWTRAPSGLTFVYGREFLDENDGLAGRPAVNENQEVRNMWSDILIAMAGALVVSWLALLVALVVIRPKGSLLRESLRLLPDLVRLLRNLMVDPTLPRGVRVRLALVMAYLAMPIDLVPDFIPVLGYADDAIVVVAVLRSVARRVGLEPMRSLWPGTPDGFAALSRLAGLDRQHGSPTPLSPADTDPARRDQLP